MRFNIPMNAVNYACTHSVDWYVHPFTYIMGNLNYMLYVFINYLNDQLI